MKKALIISMAAALLALPAFAQQFKVTDRSNLAVRAVGIT